MSWLKELPYEFADADWVTLNLTTPPPITSHLVRLLDGRFMIVDWNSLDSSFQFREISEQEAQRVAEPVRLYWGRVNWQEIFDHPTYKRTPRVASAPPPCPATEVSSTRLPNKPGRRRGRPKANYETVAREATLAEDWEQAKQTGTHKVEFARDRGMTQKEFDQLLNRVAKRKSRSDK